MKFTRLLLYIGIAIIGFWLLGFVLQLAAWALNIALIVGLVLVIVSLIGEYMEKRKK